MKPKIKALAVASAASDKKALDILMIDMRKMSGVCDYFVIASGTSTTQVRAISDHISRAMKERGEEVWHTEGESEGLWILLDLGDVVAHVFLDETRRFYKLEKLWARAPQERFKEEKKRRKTAGKRRPKAAPRRRRPRPKARPRARRRSG